jgi:hypothetical protein
MEEKYGKKTATLKTSGMIYLPTAMATILFGAAFFALLASKLKADSETSIVGVIAAGVCFVVAAVLLVRQAVSVNLEIYEKALVQHNLLSTKVFKAEDMRAILWTFPGANPMNSRAARINNTSAEIIFKDGTKTVKIQDSYYQNLEKEVSAFQRHNDIPADLETKKKGGHRYD